MAGLQTRPAYVSVERPASIELVIKKSRFIADVFPVADGDATSAALEQVRSTHPSATHICYAYKHGLETEVVRFSDAGEPGGTAGRPILETLEREGLRNTLVVVTRYFGGVLLGAGGLVRAYSGAAAQGLAAAGKALYEWHLIYEAIVDYTAWSRLERQLRDAGRRVVSVEYGENVAFTCRVLPRDVDDWIRMVQDAAGGQAVIRETGAGYYPA